ncbi:hypothetical protein VUR80DRAFT_4777 [Thermomyces stellatus]
MARSEVLEEPFKPPLQYGSNRSLPPVTARASVLPSSCISCRKDNRPSGPFVPWPRCAPDEHLPPPCRPDHRRTPLSSLNACQPGVSWGAILKRCGALRHLQRVSASEIPLPHHPGTDTDCLGAPRITKHQDETCRTEYQVRYLQYMPPDKSPFF